MSHVPVIYATSEGQTRRIAEHIAGVLRLRGVDSVAIDLQSPEVARCDWRRIQGAVLGASLHMGKHQDSAAAFVRSHRAELNAVPSAFFSVSLSAASKDPGEVAAAQRLAMAFMGNTAWGPRHFTCVAGQLAYTQYGFFKRMAMRLIARRAGVSTDTSRDHEFTDWTEVARFANALADEILDGERCGGRCANADEGPQCTNRPAA